MRVIYRSRRVQLQRMTGTTLGIRARGRSRSLSVFSWLLLPARMINFLRNRRTVYTSRTRLSRDVPFLRALGRSLLRASCFFTQTGNDKVMAIMRHREENNQDNDNVYIARNSYRARDSTMDPIRNSPPSDEIDARIHYYDVTNALAKHLQFKHRRYRAWDRGKSLVFGRQRWQDDDQI